MNWDDTWWRPNHPDPQTVWIGAYEAEALPWWRRRRIRRDCFHHDHTDARLESWIRSVLIDLGRRKLFWCVGCGKRWVF